MADAMRRPSLDQGEPSSSLDDTLAPQSHPSPDSLADDTTIDGLLEDEAALEGSDSRIYPPPPHIAARLFYRPTNQTRRRDSAASSRRNSISSAHSRSSHGAN